jgi:fluoride exporter
VIVVWVALAGAAGALARFVVDGAVRTRWAPAFPWATLAINVSGSLVLGLVTGIVLFDDAPNLVRTVVGTGFCGGYTTFSTASFETVRLVQNGRLGAAVLNGAGTLLLTVGAAGAGLALSAVGAR